MDVPGRPGPGERVLRLGPGSDSPASSGASALLPPKTLRVGAQEARGAHVGSRRPTKGYGIRASPGDLELSPHLHGAPQRRRHCGRLSPYSFLPDSQKTPLGGPGGQGGERGSWCMCGCVLVPQMLSFLSLLWPPPHRRGRGQQALSELRAQGLEVERPVFKSCPPTLTTVTLRKMLDLSVSQLSHW